MTSTLTSPQQADNAAYPSSTSGHSYVYADRQCKARFENFRTNALKLYLTWRSFEMLGMRYLASQSPPVQPLFPFPAVDCPCFGFLRTPSTVSCTNVGVTDIVHNIGQFIGLRTNKLTCCLH